ncbi:MAG: hypothetical protein JO316_13690 [Abitibacteriaceae bacterium]|nr:hypothetical protein [Abditibacteriaceae bacterium]MBV9866400.1 hypothetical protein [Abditibacteriaceae bacterium]
MIPKHKSLLKAIGGLLAIPSLAVFPLQRASAAPEAIGMSGALPDFKTVEIDNAHVYDYTFTTAPTDWWVQSGVWEMTNRWACSPGWSWFGGRSQETAAVWNKRRFSGDMSVQFYFGFKMGLTGTPSWLYHPADAAVTICGDGRNVGSGYSFIVGADGNEHSVLMRGTKVVAQSTKPEATLPRLTDSNLQGNLNDLHRRWFYVKFNKIGSRVECWLDNNLLFAYKDPKPLDLGQVALWTYNNGIMLSRVQIYYENEQRPDYIKLASHMNTTSGAATHSGKTIAPISPVIISKPIRAAAKSPRRTAALP